MSTFIKAGLWAKKKLGFQGELNLDELVKQVVAQLPPSLIQGDLIPALDNVYVLGNTQYRWKSITVGTGTIFMVDTITGIQAELSVTNGVLLVDGVSLLGAAGITFLGDNSIQNTAYIPAVSQLFNPLFADGGTLNGVIATGSYTMLSPKICFFRVNVDFSGCTNFGTSQYQITLPFPSISTIRLANGTLHQPTLSSLYHIAGITDVDTADANIMKLYYSGSTTDLAWKYNTPVGATTVTSHFDISGVYEII
jgi:hypothetical protein